MSEYVYNFGLLFLIFYGIDNCLIVIRLFNSNIYDLLYDNIKILYM